MPIVGFNFDMIHGEKKGTVQKGMRASHNIVIESIEKEELNLGKDSKKNGLKFKFEYDVKYEPGVGAILIKGHILFLEEEKKIKEILDGWNKNKKIEPELTAQLINTAIVRSSIKALSLSQEINLPPHLPIPTIIKKRANDNKAKDYIG